MIEHSNVGDLLVRPLEGLRCAERLQASEPSDLRRTAEIIKAGGIVAFPFNGVFGLFGDVDNIAAAEDIIVAKNRPRDKKLILVHLPEEVDQYADLSKIIYKREDIISLWRDVHALGIIFPASTHSPYHLTVGEGMDRTILSIWTEFSPLRIMLEHFRELGGRGLVGTSANKSGDSTHFQPEGLWADFHEDVEAVVIDHFDHLPEVRRRSTSVIDLTNHRPRLHREGNVPESEIREALIRNNFPELTVGRDVITVRARST